MNDDPVDEPVWSSPRLELLSDSNSIAAGVTPGAEEDGTSDNPSGAV
jgi:hypothetical protein